MVPVDQISQRVVTFPRVYHCLTLYEGIIIAVIVGIFFFGLLMFLNIRAQRLIRAEKEAERAHENHMGGDDHDIY